MKTKRTLVVKLDRTVYFVTIDKKRYNLEMAETQKKYQLCSFGVASFGSKDKPIRNWGRRSSESYAIFEDKAYNYHLITDYILKIIMNEHYYN